MLLKLTVPCIVFAATTIGIGDSQEVFATAGIRKFTSHFTEGAVNIKAIANVTYHTAAAGDLVNLEAFGEASDLVVPDESSYLNKTANNIFADAATGVTIEASAVNMLDNQILCGYQGWFAFPGDGAPINKWRHWFADAAATTTAPLAGDLTVDMYPTTDEYDDADLHTSGIQMRDGSYAKFFSSARPNVVLKHFQWMQTYDISGVFHFRFMGNIDKVTIREWRTMVLRNVRSAAESTGRIFAVSYDLSGTTDAILEVLKADWIKLVDEENITQSSQYIRQKGLPVLHIYGIGFTEVNVSDTTKVANLIQWLKKDAPKKYRVFLVGGVPSRWRERTIDSRSDPAWEGIYNSLDGIHPWHVGRWSSISSFDSYHTDVILKDSAHCAQKGIRYMPTMWPGFSWHNLKNEQAPVNAIPRLGGTFMWRQAYKFADASDISTVWLAQFDECDEGTAIFKVTAKTSNLPADGKWLALDADGYSVPSDHYLRLAGEAQKMLDGSKPIQATIPSSSPTRMPTQNPTTKAQRTLSPTNKPTMTKPPTLKPTSEKPTHSPITQIPTKQPTPTKPPTLKPTSKKPTNSLTTLTPTNQPTPTKPPTLKPTSAEPSTTNLKPTPSTSTPTTKLPTVKPTTMTPTPKPVKPSKKQTSLPSG